MGTSVTPIMIILSEGERVALVQRARSTKAPFRSVLRATVILLLAALVTLSEVARQTGLNRRYFATARRIGAPATVFIRQDTIEIVVSDNERCVHQRCDGTGVVQRLPAHVNP
jgi:hypothetical protein